MLEVIVAFDSAPDIKFEIGHVLFIDIVGYSMLLIHEQTEFLEKLQNIVRATASFRAAQETGRMLWLPTGDGGALVFRDSPEAPVLCAVEIAKILRKNPALRVRMGIHSGPIRDVTDLNESSNIAGAGINIAQRVMDCGDGGHILLSKRVADDLEQYARWRPLLHELGNCEVKHGLTLTIFNLFSAEFGNAQAPKRFGQRTESEANATPDSASRKSIAVLPFQSLSEDKANAYFADGIQEEVLTRLSQIADLKVISRTSTQRFRDSSDNIREIAKQLGVVNILEGTVQKADSRVRVHVQLIDAISDAHVWAERYDRDLLDIFAVESDIASKIADALKAKLTGAERRAIANRPTNNTEAHEYYLRGQYQWRNFFAPGFQKVREHFEKAIELDPAFAPAYSGLGLYYSFGAANAVLPPESWPLAENAVNKALEIDENLAEAYNPRAAVDIYYKRDWPSAERAFLRGAELNKNLAGVRHHYGICLVLLGRADEGLTQMRNAENLDPFFSGLHLHAGRVSYFLRDYDQAIKRYLRALELQPGNPVVHEYFGDAFAAKGMFNEAITQWNESLSLTGQAETARVLERAYSESGPDVALRAFGASQLEAFRVQSVHGRYIPSWNYAIAHMRAGDYDRAFASLTRAVDEPNWFALQLNVNPLLDPLRQDSRFLEIAKNVKLTL